MRAIACAALGLFFAACGGAAATEPKPVEPVHETTEETSTPKPETAGAEATGAMSEGDMPGTKPTPIPTPTPTPGATPSATPGPTASTATSSATPQSVCAHVVTLVASEFASAGTSMPADQRKQMHDDCVKEAQKERTNDPTGWACDSSCLMAATTFAAVEACKEKC